MNNLFKAVGKLFFVFCFAFRSTSSTTDDVASCGESDTFPAPSPTEILAGNRVLESKYYNSSELTTLLTELENRFPNILRVSSIGKSAVDKRDLLAVEISRNVRQERQLLKPMFKFVANMHGDETVGYALMVFLIQYLVYTDGMMNRVTNLLDTVDIWIIPTINPDGFSRSKEGNCCSLDHYVGRKNGRGIDLNRNFFDAFRDNIENISDWQYETESEAIKNFIEQNPFVLSGNLHGGAIVASYPYDNSEFDIIQGYDSKTPDDDVFRKLAFSYASLNPMMAPGTACGFFFQNGITNGNAWYKVPGGMQDFNYAFSNCFEITLELSCCKYPPREDLPAYWNFNRESLLSLIESTRQGVYGLVSDKFGDPVNGASVVIIGREGEVITSPRGEYWRLLLPGLYEVEVQAPDNSTQRQVVQVTEEEPYVRLDFTFTYMNVF